MGVPLCSSRYWGGFRGIAACPERDGVCCELVSRDGDVCGGSACGTLRQQAWVRPEMLSPAPPSSTALNDERAEMTHRGICVVVFEVVVALLSGGVEAIGVRQ